jgi:hypothetical protein
MTTPLMIGGLRLFLLAAIAAQVAELTSSTLWRVGSFVARMAEIVETVGKNEHFATVASVWPELLRRRDPR